MNEKIHMNYLNLKRLSSDEIDKLMELPNVVEFSVYTDQVRIVLNNKLIKKDIDGIEQEIEENKTLTFSYDKEIKLWVLVKYRKET